MEKAQVETTLLLLKDNHCEKHDFTSSLQKEVPYRHLGRCDLGPNNHIAAQVLTDQGQQLLVSSDLGWTWRTIVSSIKGWSQFFFTNEGLIYLARVDLGWSISIYDLNDFRRKEYPVLQIPETYPCDFKIFNNRPVISFQSPGGKHRSMLVCLNEHQISIVDDSRLFSEFVRGEGASVVSRVDIGVNEIYDFETKLTCFRHSIPESSLSSHNRKYLRSEKFLIFAQILYPESSASLLQVEVIDMGSDKVTASSVLPLKDNFQKGIVEIWQEKSGRVSLAVDHAMSHYHMKFFGESVTPSVEILSFNPQSLADGFTSRGVFQLSSSRFYWPVVRVEDEQVKMIV